MVRQTVPVLSRGKPVTLLVEDTNEAYWARSVLSCIAREARARGWRVVYLSYFAGTLPVGIEPHCAIVQSLPNSDLVQQLRQNGCMVVRMGKLPHPGDSETPAALPDIDAESILAAEHFLERGFRHVGGLSPSQWGDALSLHETFREQAEARGMVCHVLRLSSGTHLNMFPDKEGRGDPRVLKWIQDVPKPFGLLMPWDLNAAQCCAWLVQAGIRVPEDVAVLGVGNDREVCETAFPSISSIDRGIEQRTQAAFDLLDQLMAGKSVTKDPLIMQPKGIVTRESTDGLGVSDPEVAAAVRYMWDHIERDLKVSDIAKAVGVQRRKLERVFRARLGRGVYAELMRKRLDVVCDLLRSTSDPVRRRPCTPGRIP